MATYDTGTYDSSTFDGGSSMATVESYEALNNNKILKFQSQAVMLADTNSPIPTNIFAGDGSLISTLTSTYGLISFGNLDPAGITQPRAITNDEQLGAQTSEVVRSDISRDSRTVSFTALEVINRAVLAVNNGLLISQLPADGTPLAISKPSRAAQPNRRLLVLAHDLTSDIILGGYYPQAKATAFGDENWNPTAVTGQMFTFDTYLDPSVNTSRLQFIGGPGYLAYAHGGAATTLALSPTTATMSLAGSHTQQEAATATYPDTTTAVVTNIATWTSSNAGVATVSSTGLVTGVGVGTAVITASVAGGAYATAAITVTS